MLSSPRWLVDPSTVTVLHDHLYSEDRKFLRVPNLWLSNQSPSELPIRSSVSLSIESVALGIFSGDDWSSEGRGKNSVSLTMKGLKSQLDLGGETSPPTLFKTTFSAKEISISDAVASSVFESLFFTHDRSVRLEVMLLKIPGAFPDQISIDIDVPPICVTVDQDTAEFVSGFLRRFSVSEDMDEESPESPALTIRSIRISAIPIELNYRSKRLSLANLRSGDPLELLNLLPLLEGLGLTLSEVKLTDCCPEDLVARFGSAYGRDINKAQILRSLSGITPVRSFSNLAGGIGDLIGAIGKPKPARGIWRGARELLGRVVKEGLAVADLAVGGVEGLLEGVVGSPPHIEPIATHRSSSVEIMYDGHPEESNDWSEVTAPRRRFVPSSALEAADVGMTALLRGILSGGEAAISSRGVKLFLVKPVLGGVNALGAAVRSVRRAADPVAIRGIDKKYKSGGVGR